MNPYPADSLLHDVYSIYLKRRAILDRHRERYIKAWIASTGLNPGEAILLIQRFSNGSELLKMVNKKDYDKVVEELKDQDGAAGKYMFKYL